MAEVAADPVGLGDDVTHIIISRVIDNASVGIASLNCGSIKTARGHANTHKRGGGATLFGLGADHSTFTAPFWRRTILTPGTTSRRFWPLRSNAIAPARPVSRNCGIV
jgi:hypothetical protein